MESRLLTKEEKKEQQKLVDKPLKKFVYISLLWIAVSFGFKILFPEIDVMIIFLGGIIILVLFLGIRTGSIMERYRMTRPNQPIKDIFSN